MSKVFVHLFSPRIFPFKVRSLFDVNHEMYVRLHGWVSTPGTAGHCRYTVTSSSLYFNSTLFEYLMGLELFCQVLDRPKTMENHLRVLQVSSTGFSTFKYFFHSITLDIHEKKLEQRRKKKRSVSQLTLTSFNVFFSPLPMCFTWLS